MNGTKFLSMRLSRRPALKLLLALSLAAISQTIATAAAQIPTTEHQPTIERQIATRRAQALQWSYTTSISSAPKYGPYDVLAATARDGCGPPDRARYMTQLGQMGVNGQYFEMFALAPLVRYLYMYPKCMSDENRRDLLAGLTSVPRDFTAHGTMNHMVLQETSWYLLAQYFPDAHWTDNKGTHLTSAQVMAETGDLLTRRHWRSYQSGMFEIFSSTYAMPDLFPILNMADFAKDAQMARNASKEAGLEVLALKVNSFHGIILPPLFRHNFDQWNAPMPKDWPIFAAIGQQILWYYFGEPQIGAADLSNHTHEPFFVDMLALSRWLPPTAAWSMPTEDYRIRTSIPESAKWDDPTFPRAYGDTWIGHDYALATGNMLFDPNGYNDNHQTFAVAFRSKEQRNLLECRQPFWKSNLGEDNWGADGDFWSPFLQTWRLDNQRAVLLASIPQKDPWPVNNNEDHPWSERNQHKDALLQVVECRIPKAVDKLVVEDQWAFLRKGDVSIALGTLQGRFEEAKHGLPSTVAPYYTVLKVRQPKTGLYIMVDDKGGDFAEFQARAKASAPTYDPAGPTIRSGSTTVTFVPPAPEHDHPNYWKALPQATVDGKIVPYRDSPIIETPFFTLSNDILHVTGPDAIEIQGPKRPSGPRITP